MFRTFGRVLLLRQRCPPPQKLVPVARSVFSDSYLGGHDFQRSRNAVRLKVADEVAFKRDVGAAFERNGLQAVFADDVKKLICLVGSADESDLELLRSILLACASDDTREMFGMLPQFFTQYFLLCKLLGGVEAGRVMWLDEKFKATNFTAIPMLRMLYFQLLYESGCYREVLDEMSALPPDEKTTDEVTLAIASLAKIRSREAFVEAKSLFHSFAQHSRLTEKWRARYLFAWLAMSVKEYGTAYDLLTLIADGKPTKLSTNLRLSILVDVDRLEEAMLLIRTDVLSQPPAAAGMEDDGQAQRWRKGGGDDEGSGGPYRRPKVLCFDCMKQLSEAVKTKGEPELTQELTSLCQSLDASARLTNTTLEEMVFSPITKPLRKRMRIPQRSWPLSRSLAD